MVEEAVGPLHAILDHGKDGNVLVGIGERDAVMGLHESGIADAAAGDGLVDVDTAYIGQYLYKAWERIESFEKRVEYSP